MEGESRSLQNDFFNEVRKSRTVVNVYLNNGKKLTGRITSFDKFTLMLDGHQGELIVFKHAVSTVSVARPGAEAERPTSAAAPRAAPKPGA